VDGICSGRLSLLLGWGRGGTQWTTACASSGCVSLQGWAGLGDTAVMKVHHSRGGSIPLPTWHVAVLTFFCCCCCCCCCCCLGCVSLRHVQGVVIADPGRVYAHGHAPPSAFCSTEARPVYTKLLHPAASSKATTPSCYPRQDHQGS
jgi:hypothetical protein